MQLGTHLDMFLKGFDLEQSREEERNFHLLLKLRWLVHDYLSLRLRMHPEWRTKKWFLDLWDVDQVIVKDGNVRLRGDAVWWALGNDATGEWWPSDHERYPSAPYKVKIRGDMCGGYWVLEPVIAKLKSSRILKRNAEYEIEFGSGTTYMEIRSR